MPSKDLTKVLLDIMPQGERSASGFVYNINEGTLNGFYFIHDQLYDLMLMEDGALIYHGKFLEK